MVLSTYHMEYVVLMLMCMVEYTSSMMLPLVVLVTTTLAVESMYLVFIIGCTVSLGIAVLTYLVGIESLGITYSTQELCYDKRSYHTTRGLSISGAVSGPCIRR